MTSALPPLDHASRAVRLASAVAHGSPDDEPAALLVSDDANLRWLTGFTGSAGAAVVLPDRPVLLTDERYEGRVADECGHIDVVVTRRPLEEAVRLVADAGLGTVLFEAEHVTHADGARLQGLAEEDALAGCLPSTGIVERLRVVKDEAELARLGRACAITEEVLEAVLARGLVGRDERGVARAVEDGLRDHDAQVGFATIVASGPNGAVPHHEPSGRSITVGDLVTIDCGAAVDGYHADTTRTAAAGSSSTVGAALQEVFAVVAAAQEAGVAAVVAGATGGDVDDAARDVVDRAGLGERFVHGTGHGVGLRIHEDPAVGPGSTASLAPGTPLTVEPGVYLPGRGGVRIEDTVVVTADGPAERLTTSPRTLEVV